MQGEEAIAKILCARSIAVVGASSHPEKWGYKTLQTILDGGYDGRLYPINPRGGRILDLPAYHSIGEVPGDLDLAIVIVSAEAVTDTLRQVAAKGIKTAVIMTAGYGEVGHYTQEVELKNICAELGVRVLGPNLQGLIYTPNRLSAMFWPAVRMAGPLGLISHSGSVSAALAEWSVEDGLGISGLVNVGNQMDLCDTDVLRFYQQDEHTRAVAMYVEGVRNGRSFIKTASELIRKKPVVVLKGGCSAAGQRSVASHTGSMAGSNQVFTAACHQHGVLVVDDLESLFNMGKALATMRPTLGHRVFVVTSSGGGATLAVDEAERQGLEIPPLPVELIEKLRKLDLHFNATLSNPLDLAGVTAEHFERSILAIDRFDLADTFLIVFADPVEGSTEIVKRLWNSTQRNLAVAYFGGGALERKSRLEMQAAGIPIFHSPERAMQGIAAMLHATQLRQHCQAREQAGASINRKSSAILWEGEMVSSANRNLLHSHGGLARGRFLLEPEAVQLLGKYHIPYPDHALAHSADEAIEYAENLGYPVVLKIISPEVIHKSDVAGVLTDLDSAQQVCDGYSRILASVRSHLPEARIEGALVCKQALPGLEVIVGAVNDPTFGPTVMLGMGGIFAEILRDTVFRLAPLHRQDALDMIHEVKGYPLIAGLRGENACDEEALIKLLLAVSQVATEHQEIKELDLNPVRVYERGLLVLDARLILAAFDSPVGE